MRILTVTNTAEYTSRLAGGAAVLVASLTGLVAVWLFPSEIPRDEKMARAVVSPATLILPDPTEPDLGKVISFCALHTTQGRGFVVFKNGTCVILQEPSHDPVAAARRMLKETALPEARFMSERTAEGDLVVTFGGPVFHWIPADQLAEQTVWAQENLDKLLSEEERKVAKEGWLPPPDALLGLVARSRLLEDSRKRVIAKVIRAQPMPVAR